MRKISSYDLIELGFSPKYNGFNSLLTIVNWSLEHNNLHFTDLCGELSDGNPHRVFRNIRTCVINNKKTKLGQIPSKAVCQLVEYFKNKPEENGIRVKFEKVSFKQFKKDVLDCGFKFSDGELHAFYESIKLPTRATVGSAGYDFYAPFDLKFQLGESLKFPTGIKCLMDGDVVLLLAPRSSLGFKHRWTLNNTLGVVDRDYFLAKNEGHMHCKAHYCNEALEELVIKQGEAYMQGIFVPFIKTVDDNTDGIRVGGFGSTNGRK